MRFRRLRYCYEVHIPEDDHPRYEEYRAEAIRNIETLVSREMTDGGGIANYIEMETIDSEYDLVTEEIRAVVEGTPQADEILEKIAVDWDTTN